MNSLRFPSYKEWVSQNPSSDLILLDRNGIPIQTLRQDYKKRRIQWWDTKDISPYMISALIYSEDKNFHTHSGVDGNAFFFAAYNWLLQNPYRGASTISMQVASMMEERLRPESQKRSVRQKLIQVQAGNSLEEEWSKEEIFTTYINMVPMRGELVGIPTSSFALFHKSPKYLNREESLILAVLVRSPNSNPKLVLKRSVGLGKSLKWKFSEKYLKQLIDESLDNRELDSWSKNMASHYAREFHPNEKGFVKSTLDWELQNYSIQSLKKNIISIMKQNGTDGGVIVIDNRTGEILSYVGGIRGLSTAIYVDSVQAMRQAGSTLKPFLYSIAIENNLFTSSSFIKDSPLDLDVTRGVYKPSNYDKSYRGIVTVKEALASSLNIPAVRTIVKVGVEEFYYELQKFGFKNLREAEYYGYSLALGTVDIKLYDLAYAYSILARQGKDYKGNSLISPQSSFIISDILSDREARSATFGLENHLSTRFWTAVKTGTSQDMRDNWCIGYSDRYTVGVWIGNFSGEPMRNVTGVSGSGPVWRDIMEFLHRRLPSHSPNIPEQIVHKFGHFYRKGTEPAINPSKEIFSVSNKPPKILYPTDGLIVAIDPDIPPSRQKILFETNKILPNFYWFLNKKKLGRANLSYPWSPKRGKFTLKLGNSWEDSIDSIQFEVR